MAPAGCSVPETHSCIVVIMGTENTCRLWCGKWHIKFDLLHFVTLEMIPIFSASRKRFLQWCFHAEVWADTYYTVKCIRLMYFCKLFCSFRTNRITSCKLPVLLGGSLNIFQQAASVWYLIYTPA